MSARHSVVSTGPRKGNVFWYIFWMSLAKNIAYHLQCYYLNVKYRDFKASWMRKQHDVRNGIPRNAAEHNQARASIGCTWNSILCGPGRKVPELSERMYFGFRRVSNGGVSSTSYLNACQMLTWFPTLWSISPPAHVNSLLSSNRANVSSLMWKLMTKMRAVLFISEDWTDNTVPIAMICTDVYHNSTARSSN
jgi:hypothetical protein